MNVNIEQSIQILTNALNAANLKGVFNLSDSVNIVTALQAMEALNKEYTYLKELENQSKNVDGKLAGSGTKR